MFAKVKNIEKINISGNTCKIILEFEKYKLIFDIQTDLSVLNYTEGYFNTLKTTRNLDLDYFSITWLGNKELDDFHTLNFDSVLDFVKLNKYHFDEVIDLHLDWNMHDDSYKGMEVIDDAWNMYHSKVDIELEWKGC